MAMIRLTTFFLLGIVVTASESLAAQAADPAHIIVRSNSINIVRSSSIKALRQKLQRAADRGYRVVPLADAGFGALLEKATANSEPVEYLVLSTSKTKTLEDELNKASAGGYRVVSVLAGLTVVMERKKGAATRTHQYKVQATKFLQTMEDELRGPAAVGYRVVGQTRASTPGWDTNEFVAILERPFADAERTRSEYLLLSTMTTSTMQRELQEAADRGYRLTRLQGLWGDKALLEKAIGDVDPVVVEYIVLSTSRDRTMQREVDMASDAGYHVGAVLVAGGRNEETVIVMERSKGTTSRTHEQRLLRWTKFGGFSVLMRRSAGAERELFAELAQGFGVVGQASFNVPLGGGTFVILERRVQ